MEPGCEIQAVGSIAQACRLLPYSTPIYQKRALFARAACPFPMGQNLPPVQKYMAGGASPWAQNGSALPTAGSWREGRRSRRGKDGVVPGECALRVWRFLLVGTSEMGAQSCKGYPCAFRRQSAANPHPLFGRKRKRPVCGHFRFFDKIFWYFPGGFVPSTVAPPPKRGL